MALSSVEFLADVVAVYASEAGNKAFGSGRVIAPGLVLTSRHLVDHPKPELAARFWKVCPRTKHGEWGTSSESVLLWRGQGDLDIALLQTADDSRLMPAVKPKFAWSDFVEPIANVRAAGFPKAWLMPEKSRAYLPRGTLDINTDAPQYEWSVPTSNKPDDPHGWEGMSGAGVCHLGLDDLHLFGVIQEVPSNFSGGQLVVARVLDGFADPSFVNHLTLALGSEPEIFKWISGTSSRKSDPVILKKPNVPHAHHEVPEAIRRLTRIISTRQVRVEVWATDHYRLQAGITANLHIRVRTFRGIPQSGTIGLKFKGDDIRFGPTATFGFYNMTESSFNDWSYSSPYETVVPVMVSAHRGKNTQLKAFTSSQRSLEIQIIVSDPFGSQTLTPISFNPTDIGL